MYRVNSEKDHVFGVYQLTEWNKTDTQTHTHIRTQSINK